jgi:arylformamidase
MGDGVRVWRDYDQAALDAQYDAVGTVPSLDPYIERYAAESARVRAALRPRTVAYGTGEREVLDAFAAPRPGAPVLLCMHGGYWRRFSKDAISFFAEPFVQAGAAVVIPSYSLAPAASLDDIVAEIRGVAAWTYANAAAFNGDPRRIHASGHSAGGQLAAMLATTPWHDWGLPPDLIKGVCGVSGLYDLEPVRLSNCNEWLHLDEAAALRNSPARRAPDVPTPLLAFAGAAETDEFRRQTVDAAAAWRAAGSPADARILPGFNHFDITLDVLSVGSALRAGILELIGA